MPTPARGTKKPFTGWFFPRHRRAVPFSSLLLLCSTKKRPQMRSLFRGGEGGIRPAALGQCRRQPGELKNHSLDGFFPATGGSFPSHPSFFYAARKRDRKCDLFFVAEKEGFEPSRQSPQPTPLAGEPLTATWVLLHGYIAGAMLNYLAEREGFEPPVPCGITGFQDQLHKPLGHLSIFKLYNYSKGFSHCQAGRFSKKWLKPFLRVFSDFASRVRSRAAKPAKYENLWFSSVLPHMSSKPE